MAILKLTPSCKDYLWGGSRLRTDFGIKSDLEPLAEAWVLSCHPDGPSYLPDGTTLADYVAAHPEALGTDCADFEQFPVLTKFIDASKNLSIQVHPSNDYALKNEHQYGKTEMWYVLDCVPGAYLYYGFTHEISKEEFAERIKNNTLTEVLNAVPVHRGDCFFIPSGTLHTICQGIVVAEVQQNSNVTYRVYDYGRVGADGKPRALHIEKALDVTRRTPPQKHDFGSHLAQCEYFTVDAKKGAFDGAAGEKSFVSLLITDGAGTLTCGGETVKVKKGESYFIPAGSGKYAVTGDCETLGTVGAAIGRPPTCCSSAFSHCRDSRGRACPARRCPIGGRLRKGAGPGMPGPYRAEVTKRKDALRKNIRGASFL